MNKSSGYYFGQYDILMDKYTGLDFSRRCFVFPGQGAAFPGMFRDEYFQFEAIRKKFELADVLVEKFHFSKISDYILNPDKLEKETVSAVSNIALFTLELALFDILVSLKVTPEIITGHSFGEYASLVASGVVSFEEMISIIYYRDSFCPKPHSLGFLIAVNADVKQVNSLLKKGEYFISNMNSPHQTVVAVSPKGVDEISRIFEDENIKYKILYTVPQPYHSPYLEESKKKIEKYLKTKKFSFKKPRIPFFSSVLKKRIDENNFKKEDIEGILINQITTQVDFIHQSRSIYELGCPYFLEIGPRKMFTVFIDDIMAADGKEVKTDYVLNILQKEKKSNFKKIGLKGNKLFSVISKTIAEITGYEVEKIYPEGRFQEDLGIDSIKRADILLTVFDKLKILLGEDFDTSEFKSINDVITYIERITQSGYLKGRQVSVAERKTDFRRYVFVPVEEPLQQEYLLNNYQKNTSFLLNIDDILKKGDISLKKLKTVLRNQSKKKMKLDIVICINDVRLDSDKIIIVFKFFREFSKFIERDVFNVVLFSSDQDVDPYVQSLASFFKSLKKEFPKMFFKYIHCNEISHKKDVLTIASKEVNETDGTDVIYKNGKRFVLKPQFAKDGKKSNLNEKSVIVAIGGAKGITFSLVKNISQKYKSILYLVGRSKEEDTVVCANIAELKKKNPTVYYVSLDARNKQSLGQFLSNIRKKHKRIDLIINGAGTVKIGFLKDKTDEDIEDEFQNKVLPALNILNLASKYKPKRIINFSSIISRYGSAGQSIYTSANELVGRLTVEYNKVSGKIGSAAVVHWPAWDGVGMTHNKGVSQKLNEYGVSLLKPDEADTLFSSDVASSGDESIYYLDTFDDLSFSFPLNNLESYTSLIGERGDPFGFSSSKAVFKKIFQLQDDTYLKDHTINGSSYVPAAVGISMFLCLGKMYFKQFPVLKNIVLKNPIIVKNKPVECLLETVEKNGTRVFSIKSNVIHFYSETEQRREKTIPIYPFEKVEREIVQDDVYKKFHSKNGLQLGPTFQSIQKILVDKNKLSIAVIENSLLLPLFGLNVYDRLIQWIDGCFQILAFSSLSNEILLPVAVSQLSLFSKIHMTNKVYFIPSSVEITDEGVRGNVLLVNEKGETILELVGIFLKKSGDNKSSNEK